MGVGGRCLGRARRGEKHVSFAKQKCCAIWREKGGGFARNGLKEQWVIRFLREGAKTASEIAELQRMMAGAAVSGIGVGGPNDQIRSAQCSQREKMMR